MVALIAGAYSETGHWKQQKQIKQTCNCEYWIARKTQRNDKEIALRKVPHHINLFLKSWRQEPYLSNLNFLYFNGKTYMTINFSSASYFSHDQQRLGNSLTLKNRSWKYIRKWCSNLDIIFAILLLNSVRS